MLGRISLGPVLGPLLALTLALGAVLPVSASSESPAESAEQIRTALLDAQLALPADPATALAFVSEAQSAFEQNLSPAMRVAATGAHRRATTAFESMGASAAAGDAVGFAAARAQARTAILAGSALAVEAALRQGDSASARNWLATREYRTATRYSRAGADATLAVESFAQGGLSAGDAALTVRADLYDTYQARLGEALRDLREADNREFAVRRAELSALAGGYFAILAPAYAEQRGTAALQTAEDAFAELQETALATSDLSAALDKVNKALEGFRAAPLSLAEQARRAGQLLRFLHLIPVEYERGVSDGRVIHDFEIQEAAMFQEAAYAAFSDLRDLLPAEVVAPSAMLFDRVGAQLSQAGPDSAADPRDVQRDVGELASLLQSSMPAAWLSGGSQGDFDVIASLLDQVESAIGDGDYAMAESARLEAYAIMETGPEARLIILAPRLAPNIENLFWNGRGDHRGLAYLIERRAALADVKASRARLDALLAEAEELLGQESSPLSVATNAGLIVFREGMEAVVILASLMSSMRRADERRYRKPMWVGALAACAATVATWMLARGVLQSLARYGEKLEAVVSLIAVCVLLVIMNWFFHKIYWTSWIAQFHSRKRQLLKGETGLVVGLVTLGFASIYREGFEVVLFLQALVLEAGSGVVLAGTVAGLIAVITLGIITFRLQVSLPYRKMLIVTGALIGVVLLQIVGKTVYTLQVVGWMPIDSIQSVSFPYWWGVWFGVYPTREGLLLQVLAAGFVLGSFYLAEWRTRSRRRRVSASEA